MIIVGESKSYYDTTVFKCNKCRTIIEARYSELEIDDRTLADDYVDYESTNTFKCRCPKCHHVVIGIH